jgi:hypothetical protein
MFMPQVGTQAITSANWKMLRVDLFRVSMCCIQQHILTLNIPNIFSELLVEESYRGIRV